MSEEIKAEKIRKVFLDDLPRGGKNRGNRINWEGSEGYEVEFIYDDIKGIVKIEKYENNYIWVKYLDKEPFKISVQNFKYCLLGNMLGRFTSEFKYKIGQIFKDDKRNLVITDMEVRQRIRNNNRIENQKYYKYHCNKCGYKGWLEESQLKRERGCSCCAGKVVVENINSIWHTDKWMIPIINDDEFCKTHTHGSSDRIIPTCPNCGRKLNKSSKVSNIYNFHSIGCICSDKISYGEKVAYNVLEQLDVDFTTQLSKMNFKWCNNYLYDFYINSYNILIEVQGEQHYIQTTRKGERVKTLEEEQENDRLKKELALSNGIKDENYLVIDCRKSELEFIKQNIINSKLSKLFDLSKINWSKVQNFALGTRVKEACDLWNTELYNAREISKIMKLSHTTICRWLAKGSKLSWCNYNPKEEMIKTAKKNGKIGTKPVICLENGKVFESATDLEYKSLEEFGVKLLRANITNAVNGKLNKYKGLSFKYVSNMTEEEKIKYNITI